MFINTTCTYGKIGMGPRRTNLSRVRALLSTLPSSLHKVHNSVDVGLSGNTQQSLFKKGPSPRAHFAVYLKAIDNKTPNRTALRSRLSYPCMLCWQPTMTPLLPSRVAVHVVVPIFSQSLITPLVVCHHCAERTFRGRVSPVILRSLRQGKCSMKIICDFDLCTVRSRCTHNIRTWYRSSWDFPGHVKSVSYLSLPCVVSFPGHTKCVRSTLSCDR
jgi:hypothetical protein